MIVSGSLSNCKGVSNKGASYLVVKEVNVQTLISSKSHTSSRPGVARYSNKSRRRGIGSCGVRNVLNELRYFQSQDIIVSSFPKHLFSVGSCRYDEHSSLEWPRVS